MNTITRIENGLKAINQATFQNLINHLLHLQGNKFIGAPGAVVGKEKTSKGSPDSFFVNNEKYIFVECTTKERLKGSKSFFDKLSKDIHHCFDEKATSISKEKIEKIILAFTEKITPEEDKKLRELIYSYNPETRFDILNIQNLPLAIYDLPKLATEYLDVEIVKGDIFTLEEFLLKTTKGLQPSLTNDFVGREEELSKCIEALKYSDRLLLSGGAGVGKSKLAVKLLEELSKENFIPIVIQSSAVPLWDDFNHYFQAGKNYIVLFDDANKSIQNLNYLLSIIDKPKSFLLKVIITSRDYVKKQVSIALHDFVHEEIILSEFKDEEIEKIILKALPNLRYHVDIKRKIIELAKGNARVALMATYSVTPDAETNYLDSPVLLYEKYFKKIAGEIGIFDNPTILKSLALVSFFGVLDKNNEQLKANLLTEFDVDWNDLWSAIMELHAYEIIDVYANEVAKVSDQVLATYAFYKCFIDKDSAVIHYADWIKVFIQDYPHRIKATLIDVNNTFVYYHVRDLVLPHLNELVKTTISDEQLYAFYKLFWFYKDRECLLYLKNWVKSLQPEPMPEELKFDYVHNDHTNASKFFELLKHFWGHANEWLKPSFEITLDLLQKQPHRLPEVLKFTHDTFGYQWTDIENGYFRQNALLDVLFDKNQNVPQKAISNGIFFNIAEVLLGWHFTEYGSGKGMSITIYNFDLYKSDELMKLRKRILQAIHELFEPQNKQIQKILHKIIHPGGDIDKTIYSDELSIYRRIISEKLDIRQYAHCQFVKKLAGHLTKAGIAYPADWNNFIESDIMKISQFLKPGWEYRDDKPIDVYEQEKRQEYDEFVRATGWPEIEKFLFDISELHNQQADSSWLVENAITDIYISIAKKGRMELEKALRLFFSGKVSLPLRSNVINFALQQQIMTGTELYHIIEEYEFGAKDHWMAILLAYLPEEQVNEFFLDLLLKTFAEHNGSIFIYSLTDYLKYGNVFEKAKKQRPELGDHNIITYLTSIILSIHPKQGRFFGYDFCENCAAHFNNHIPLFKQAYQAQKGADNHFDYNGKQLEAVLKLDSNFFIEYIEQQLVDSEYLTFKLEDFKLDYIWTLPDYEEILERALNIIITKCPLYSNWGHPAITLFTFQQPSEENNEKALSFLEKYMANNATDKQRVLVVINIILHRYRNTFVSFLQKFLILNKDIEVFKSVYFNKGGAFSGSRVPRIQGEIDLCKQIIDMIKGLPDVLSYSGHIDEMEQRVGWLKRDIESEQRREFEDEYY